MRRRETKGDEGRQRETRGDDAGDSGDEQDGEGRRTSHKMVREGSKPL